MVESLVWDKNSIININNDTMTKHTGTATVSNGSLVLGAKSSATYNYSYDTTDNIKQTKNLKLILDVINSNETVNSRYDESVQVEIYIQYYKKQLDDKGNVTGYLLGINDTYQINPYFRHEVEGYIDTYELGINDDMMVFIEINFINNSDNTITFVNPRVFNSMSVMDAIDEYGGGDTPGPSEPTLKNDLILYSTSGNYTISNTDGKLILEVELSDDIIKKYANDREMAIKWLITVKSGQGSVSIEPGSDYKRVHIDGVEYTIWNNYRTITALSNGVINVRVEIDGNNTVYAERDITITNNEVVDMELTIKSPSGKIEGTNYLNASIKLLPETNRDGYARDIEVVSLATYDEYGKAEIGNWTGKVQSGIANFQIRGVENGKVKLTVRLEADYNNPNFFPQGFTKEFIIDVVDIPEVSDLYTKTPNGKVIDKTKEYIDIIVGTNRNKNLTKNSRYGLESLDGVGQGYIKLLNSSDNKELTYRVYPLAVGKIKFWGEMHENDNGRNKYVGRVEVNIDITELYKELTTNLTTNTGLFDITEGKGQLEVYCTPNYNYAGNFSYSQVSVDDGSVNIRTRDNNKVIIEANREGHTTLICKPERGPSVSHIITISNQYPNNVKLTTPDNVDMIVSGGQLTVNVTPGNNYNNNFYRFNWTFDKVNPEVDCNINYGDYNRTATITGKGLGLLRANCYREVDNMFLASKIFKIVQSIGSIEVKLPYPDTKNNWVLFRRRDQNNKLFLGTLNGAVTKCMYVGESIDYDVMMTEYSQYYINDDGKTWRNKGNWSNNKNMAGQATELIASSVDVYDSNNMLILTASEYKTVNFADIIYGVGHIGIKLRTSKKTVFTNTEVKIEALNYDETVDYDWQFTGTDVTVVEKNSGYVIFKSTSTGDLKVNYIMSESGSILTGIALKVIDKPTNLKYIRLYITGAQRDGKPIGFCNIAEFDILDSNGNSVLTDSCVYTSDSVYSSSEVTANAFDKNTRTIWHAADNNKAHWLKVEFASVIDLPSSYVITRRTDNYNDKIVTWELQGSTDGNTWITLDSHTNDTDWSSGYTRTFSL